MSPRGLTMANAAQKHTPVATKELRVPESRQSFGLKALAAGD